MRCRHVWAEVKRYFVPPPRDLTKATGPRDSLDRLSFGFTVVELRCKACGDVSSRQLLGDARSDAS